MAMFGVWEQGDHLDFSYINIFVNMVHFSRFIHVQRPLLLEDLLLAAKAPSRIHGLRACEDEGL
jgi:hypothetical protein